MSNTKFVVVLILALALGFGGGYLAQMVGGGTDVSDLSDKVSAISDKIGGLQDKVGKMPDDLASFATVDEVSALKSDINNLEQKVEDTGVGVSGEDVTDLKNKVQGLENKVNELEDAGTTEGTAGLKVGYVNATEAFTVFTDAVSKERESAKAKDEELRALREKAIQGEITEEEYKNQSITLQAEKLKAQLAIDLAMIDKMIEAQGFQEVSDRLKQLRDQVTPIMDQLDSVLENLKSGSAIPEDEQTLSQINNQYQQLDDLLTRLIESKIFQITNREADSQGYDLVFRQENVLLYRDGNTVDDLTDMTKRALREDLQA
ncbi:hypothetical protein KGY79_11690 [Candidatus Bipolaricaulota bacterium]|nr:hypothetical protein [Candidatus Bipolaricaulota bacterium]